MDELKEWCNSVEKIFSEAIAKCSMLQLKIALSVVFYIVVALIIVFLIKRIKKNISNKEV